NILIIRLRDFPSRESTPACFCFFFQAEDGIRDRNVTGVQTCALPIYLNSTSLHINEGMTVWLVKTGCYFAIDHSDLKLGLVTVTVFFRGCNSWANIVITVAVWLKLFETIDDYLPFKL